MSAQLHYELHYFPAFLVRRGHRQGAEEADVDYANESCRTEEITTNVTGCSTVHILAGNVP